MREEKMVRQNKSDYMSNVLLSQMTTC